MICREIEPRDHAAALHWQKSSDEKELKPRFLQQDLQQSGNAGDTGPHTDRHPLFQMRPLRGVPDYRSDDQFDREGSSYSRFKSIVSACLTTEDTASCATDANRHGHMFLEPILKGEHKDSYSSIEPCCVVRLDRAVADSFRELWLAMMMSH